MPRSPRIELAGAIHHVTARGNRRQVVFRDDQDRLIFLAELRRAIKVTGWVSLSYCLMGNHFHFAVETPRPNLGEGMRDFLSRFVQRVNARLGLPGRMFQERFHSALVTSEEYLATLLRYIALNPVNAGLCERPEHWRWSSHRDLLAQREGSLVAAARVEELLAPWGGAPGGRYAGLLAPTGRWGTWADATDPRPRPSLAALLTRLPLDQALREARSHGYRLREIAEATGLSEPTISRRSRPAA